jgi:hypothetical protein
MNIGSFRSGNSVTLGLGGVSGDLNDSLTTAPSSAQRAFIGGDGRVFPCGLGIATQTSGEFFPRLRRSAETLELLGEFCGVLRLRVDGVLGDRIGVCGFGGTIS